MKTQPHILFITADEMRYDCIGPRKPSFLRMPHLDQFCRKGVRFDRAYAQCPVCVPARRLIMAGQDALTFFHPGPDCSRGLDASVKTLPACLGELGYHTALIGKAHWGPHRVRDGFDELVGADQYYREMAASGESMQPMRHGLGQCEFYPGMATVPETRTLTSWTTEKAVEFLRYQRDPSQPFFMWLSYHKPHPPFDPPEPYYSMYRNCAIPDPICGDWAEDDRLPPSLARPWKKQSDDLMTSEVVREARAAYYGLCTQIDYNLGRVMQALHDEGLIENTLIVFTSDHGEYLGDHHTFGKFTPHEASARLPFVLQPPAAWGTDWRGQVDEHLVTHSDLLTTFVNAAGGTPPDEADGQDLCALLRGELTAPRDELEGIFSENQYWMEGYDAPDYLSLLDGRWKYIWYPEGGMEQLFDLETDPDELRDRSSDPEAAEEKARLRTRLIERQTARGNALVKDGDLIQIPVRPMDLRQARGQGHHGFHGESFSGRGLPNGDILH